MEINVQNDINLSSLENTNQNDDLLDLTDDKKTKKPTKTTQQSNDKDSPETADVDDIVYKNQLIKKINAYNKVFREFLTEIKPTQLEKKTIDELEGLLSQIKDIVSSRNIEGNVNGLISLVPLGIENMGISMGYDLEVVLPKKPTDRAPQNTTTDRDRSLRNFLIGRNL
jgi:hypothetical protein